MIVDNFLKEVIQQGVSVSIFLKNGVRLEGKISVSDKVALILTRDGNNQLILRDAIATVMPKSGGNVSSNYFHPLNK